MSAGARLFEAICELEEYYPTRTEMGILGQNIEEIVSLVAPRLEPGGPGQRQQH